MESSRAWATTHNDPTLTSVPQSDATSNPAEHSVPLCRQLAMAPYDVDVGHFTLYQPCTRLQAIINASMVLVERNQSSTQPVTPYLKKIQQAWVGHFNPFQVHVKFNLHDLVVEGDAISKTLMRRLRESLVRAEVCHLCCSILDQ